MSILSSILKWAAFVFAAIVGSGVLAYFLWRMGHAIRLFVRALRYFAIPMIVAATLYGGAKNIRSRFAADEGLQVTAAVFTRATNETDRTTLTYTYTGPDVDLPIHIRSSVSNEWESLGVEWVYDGRVYEDGVNTVSWHVLPPASNIEASVYYYLGNDPPPVEIEESGGVWIVDYYMSSTNMWMQYAVDGAVLRGKTGTVAIELSEESSPWRTIYEAQHTATVTNEVNIPGFYIGKDTRWRVRMEVPQ